MEMFVIFVLSFLCLSSQSEATAPYLRILPEGATFVRPYGSNLLFRCEIFAVGQQQLDVNLQWFDKDGNEIVETAGPNRLVYIEKEDDSPTKKLYLTHIRPEHAGTYSCSGMIEGNEQTQRVSLLLFKDITFDYAPSPQHPRVGSNALIQCRVSGQPIPTISWRYRGRRLPNDGKYGQDVNGLWIKNISKEDDGLYTCRAEVDSEGRYDERELNVIAHIPPQMVRKTESFVGVQSHEFAISCKANAIPDPKYEFTKDGYSNPLHTTDRRFIDVDSGTIHFRPLHKEDEGTYLCNASNNAGEDTAEITLTVQIPPTIYDLKNITQTENLTTTLFCRSYGDPAPNMTFQKAGNAFDYSMGENEDGRITLSNPGAGELQMVVKDLNPDDMANYTCKSSNVAGFHERNGTITVLFKPRFPADHVRQIYSWPGKKRNMTCFSLAEPMPSIEWIRYQYPLFDNETYRVYHMGKNSNLQVLVREVDQGWIYGNYTCRVRNEIGQSDLLIDLHRALAPGQPASVVIAYVTSDTVKLDVEPPLDNGGVEVTSYRVEYEEKILIYMLDEEIIVENLRPSTTFLMRVRALNEVGYGEPYSITVVTANVQPPSKLVLTSDRESNSPYTYEVTWKKPITGGRPIREYEFKFRQYKDPEATEMKHEEWTIRRAQDEEYQPMTYFMLVGLLPQTTYEIEVRARNDLGWSVPSDFFTYSTLPGTHPIADNDCTILRPSPIFVFLLVLIFAVRDWC